MKLARVKVAGAMVAVADEMSAGSTKVAEVDVEFTTNPLDATLEFAPNLKSYDEGTKKGKWALNMGDNSLKITVKKGAKTKEYTLKMKRLEEGEPLLKELKVDGVLIAPKEVPDFMNVDPTKKEVVKIEYNADGDVTTTPNVATGADWALKCGENTLKLVVTKGSKTKNYTLKITRLLKLASLKVGSEDIDIKDERG